MKVIDLILKLKQLDPNRTVVVDVSPVNSEGFHLVSVADCDEIDVPTGEKYVMVFTAYGQEELNQN